MTFDRRRIRSALPGLAVVISGLTLAADPAEAQFGYRYGFGYGYGYGRFGYYTGHPAEVNYLNQRSLQNAARATPPESPRGSDHFSRSNAYYHHLREPSYLDRYDEGTRREIEARIGRWSDGPPPSQVAQRGRAEARPARAALPGPVQPATRKDPPPPPVPVVSRPEPEVPPSPAQAPPQGERLAPDNAAPAGGGRSEPR